MSDDEFNAAVDELKPHEDPEHLETFNMSNID
jgi:hypothetical protein